MGNDGRSTRNRSDKDGRKSRQVLRFACFLVRYSLIALQCSWEKMGGGGLDGLFGQRSDVCGWMGYMHASMRGEERSKENLLYFLTMRIVYIFSNGLMSKETHFQANTLHRRRKNGRELQRERQRERGRGGREGGSKKGREGEQAMSKQEHDNKITNTNKNINASTNKERKKEKKSERKERGGCRGHHKWTNGQADEQIPSPTPPTSVTNNNKAMASKQTETSMHRAPFLPPPHLCFYLYPILCFLLFVFFRALFFFTRATFDLKVMDCFQLNL
ncbi:MAG: hypothetical protein JOS17DRAFT_5116 [Linnemannia elongata]|nr:MAG: hypothetical protein JOS17DRAFT_5116 [Linnemannia elongata]